MVVSEIRQDKSLNDPQSIAASESCKKDDSKGNNARGTAGFDPVDHNTLNQQHSHQSEAKRVRFNEEQVKILKHEFEIRSQAPYLTNGEVAIIAMESKLDQKQVRKWFYNKAFRSKGTRRLSGASKM